MTSAALFSPQRYLFFITGNAFSGAEKRMLITALEVHKRTQEPVTVYITAKLYASLASKFSVDKFAGIEFKVDPVVGFLPSKLNTALRYFYRFLSLTNRESVLHISQYKYPDAWLGKLAKLRGNKVFFEVTSPDVAQSSLTKKLANSAAYSDGLICVSKNVERLVKNQMNGSQQVRILRRKTPFVAFDVAKGADIAQKNNTIVYAHRLIARKNPLLATQVFISLAQKYPDWTFLICGQGPLEHEVSAAVDASKLTNVRFLGFQAGMTAIINEARVFVSLIEPDNYPSQSVLEALSLGCALLVSDTGESKSAFIADSAADSTANGAANGFAVELSAAAVMEGLTKLIESEDIDAYCMNSIQHYNANYGLQLYVDDSLALYDAAGLGAVSHDR